MYNLLNMDDGPLTDLDLFPYGQSSRTDLDPYFHTHTVEGQVDMCLPGKHIQIFTPSAHRQTDQEKILGALCSLCLLLLLKDGPD